MKLCSYAKDLKKREEQREGMGRGKEVSFFSHPPPQALNFGRIRLSSAPCTAPKRRSRTLFKPNTIVANSEGKQLGFLWGERRPERVGQDCKRIKRLLAPRRLAPPDLRVCVCVCVRARACVQGASLYDARWRGGALTKNKDKGLSCVL